MSSTMKLVSVDDLNALLASFSGNCYMGEEWEIDTIKKMISSPAPQIDDEQIFGWLKQVDPQAVRLPSGFKQFAHVVLREFFRDE